MKRILLAVSLLLVAAQSGAWGQRSHNVVCDIAWRNLETSAKQEVRRLLADAKQKTFAEACAWADQIKSQSRYEETRPHHYINVDRSATSVSVTEECREKGCVLSAIEAYTQVLKGIEVERYSNNRSKALMFLGHFVGDIHQPLHVSYEDDRGGNQRLLSYSGKEYSLHYVWDTIIPEIGLSKNWRIAGEQLDKQIADEERELWRQSGTITWANESLMLTRQIYAELPGNGIVSKSFFNQYFLIAERRLQQAGIRLAAILNDIYR